MSLTAFSQRFDSLPDELPIFPLSGVLLLPRGKLPLNIFEERYINMVDDAMRQDRLIGMIQPSEAPQNTGAGAGAVGVAFGAGGGSEVLGPRLFPTGCAGRITEITETEDGRYVLTLTGLCRFNIDKELQTHRGYRRVRPDWTPYAHDYADNEKCDLDRQALTQLLHAYFDKQGITANWEAIDNTDCEGLVTCLAMICPFEANEKQALLEAENLAKRTQIMMALLEMAVCEMPQCDLHRQ